MVKLYQTQIVRYLRNIQGIFTHPVNRVRSHSQDVSSSISSTGFQFPLHEKKPSYVPSLSLHFPGSARPTIQVSSKITLLENEVLVTDDKEVAEIFNEYFVNITDSLGIIQPKDALTPTDGLHV